MECNQLPSDPLVGPVTFLVSEAVKGPFLGTRHAPRPIVGLSRQCDGGLTAVGGAADSRGKCSDDRSSIDGRFRAARIAVSGSVGGRSSVDCRCIAAIGDQATAPNMPPASPSATSPSLALASTRASELSAPSAVEMSMRSPGVRRGRSTMPESSVSTSTGR